MNLPPKKILIACSYPIFTQRMGGMDYFFWELDQQLKRKNYKVAWLFQKGGAVSHYLERGMDFELIEKDNDFTEGLFNWIRNNKDGHIFIGHFLDYQSTVSKKIKKELALPCLYVDHMSRSDKPKSWAYKLKRRLKGILFYPKIDGIIAVSQQVKQTILNEMGFFWNTKIQVIYNGLPLAQYKIEEKVETGNGKVSLFCIGHLIREKGFQVVIAACRKLQENNIPFHLTLAGDGSFKKELVDLARQQLPVGSYEFVGNITNQPHFLNQSDIVIIPSLWKEAFGFTIVEAMLMKKVIFASAIGAIPEILDEPALLFEAGNSDALVALIKDYKNNKEKYIPLAEQLFQRAIATFSLDKMVTAYIDCIEKKIEQTK